MSHSTPAMVDRYALAPIDLAPRLFEPRTDLLRTPPRTTSPRGRRRPALPRRSIASRLPAGLKVTIALGAVYLLWGSTFLANGIAVTTIPPFLMLAARFSVAGAVLFVIAVRSARTRPGWRRPTWRQWRDAAVTGCVLLVGGTGLVTAAQVHVGSGTAALLCATVPLWLALLARIRFGDRLSGRAWLGLLVGLAGVAALVDPSGGQLLPTLVVLLGAVAWAVGSLRSRTANVHNAPLVASAMEMLGAGAGFLAAGVALGEPFRFAIGDVDRTSLLALVYLVTAGSIVAFTAYRWLLSNVATSLVGSYAYVNPVVAVGLGWAFAAEVVTGRTLIGGAVVLASVVLLVTGRPGEPVPAQPTSGGDVFAGERRWHDVRRQLAKLPASARLDVRRGSRAYRLTDPAPLDTDLEVRG